MPSPPLLPRCANKRMHAAHESKSPRAARTTQISDAVDATTTLDNRRPTHASTSPQATKHGHSRRFGSAIKIKARRQLNMVVHTQLRRQHRVDGGRNLIPHRFVVISGTLNFLALYNALITARILLSWFPQAQGQPLLQPLFVVTDPFLNLFRGWA